MKKIYNLFFVFILLLGINNRLTAQTIWNGNPVSFTKNDFANWKLPENQDRITDNVWITRGDIKPIFNAAVEDLEASPKNTRWAFGSISDGVENLSFSFWEDAIGGFPVDMIDQNMVLYIVSDSIYIDITFTSWTSGEGTGGGGFSYTRSTGTASDVLWTGDPVTFSKENYADWTLAENQDRITENVWLTRADIMGIFNAAVEDSYDYYEGFGNSIVSGPTSTEWAFGSIADGVENLDFNPWIVTVREEPPTMVGKNMVMHLLEEDIYIDIQFISWTSGEGDGGGGFSYTRSTGSAMDTYWTGAPITFTKENYADWTLAENQDRITENVWITRADNQGIFNAAKEESFIFAPSVPANTLWAFGSTADGIQNLDFNYFLETVSYNPPTTVDEDMVMYLVKEDIYIDIKFTSWTSGQNGGGFSYIRSSGPTTSNNAPIHETIVSCYPNPASGYITVEIPAESTSARFELYNIQGKKVLSRYLEESHTRMSVDRLIKGFYIYRIYHDTSVSEGKIIIE